MKWVWYKRQSSRRIPWILTGVTIAFAAVTFVSLLVYKINETENSFTLSSRKSSKPKNYEKPIPTPPLHFGLGQSANKQLVLLGDYEQRLKRGFSQMMFFVDVPLSMDEVAQKAEYTATVLLEFDKRNVEPLVILEAVNIDIRNVDSNIFDAYFRSLKTYGVTNQSIGLWAPFPEPNIPEWSSPDDRGNTNPELFSENFAKAATPLKKTFTKAKTLVLLNGATYKSYDVDYIHGGSYEREDLLRYVEGLSADLVDAVCLQGFPWAPDDFDAGRFLDADLAIAIAQELNVKEVRLNTGSFGRMYDTVVPPEQRKAILNNIFRQARQIKQAGYNVTMDLFTEDKFDTPENADWSYSTPEAWEVFREFVSRAPEKGINLTIFDLAE